MPHENTDVKLCFASMNAKADRIARLRDYYKGNHPIAFKNKKMREVIPKEVVFVKNQCDIIVNSTRNRLAVQAWTFSGDVPAEGEDAGTTTQDTLNELWRDVLVRTMGEAHLSALVTGQGYIMVWPDEDGKPKAFHQSPAQTEVIYESWDPYTPRVACKRWTDGGKYFLNLYYPDAIWYFMADKEPTEASTYKLVEFKDGVNPKPNEHETIPVFEFRFSTMDTVGDLTVGVLSLQDSMNKILNDMMVASEFQAFMQRYVIGNFDPKNPPTIGPGSIMQLPPGAQGEQPVSVGAFPTTNPENFLKPIAELSVSQGIESSTPVHFFTGQSGNPSGEALQTLEAPLVQKVEEYQRVLEPTWKDAMIFTAKIASLDVAKKDVGVIWQEPRTTQESTKANTRLINTQAGIPIKNILRDEGWSEDELEELEDDMAEQVDILKGEEPSVAPIIQASRTLPPTADQVEPSFDGVAVSPDIAGEVLNAGIIARAVKRRENKT